jgi:two-component system, OmpR family, sensor kinase
LRGRLVVLVGVGGAILGLAGWLGSSLALQREFDMAVDEGLTERVADVGAAWRPGATTLADPFAQVLSRSGVVLAHSVAAPDLPMVTSDVLTDLPRQGRRVEGDIPDLRGPVRLYVRPSHAPVGDVIVVAAPLETLDAARERLERDVLGLLGALLLVLLVGTWALVGAALRPVGRMTEAADGLVESSGGRAALPVPRGGDELTRLARTLNRLLDRLAAVIDRERALVDEASHELRTPLSVLRGELELTLDEPDPGHQRAGVERSLREVNRLSALADDLFLLARESGGVQGPRTPVQITSWLRQIVTGCCRPSSTYR